MFDISNLQGDAQSLFLYVVPFLGLITLLVFVHEMGHYISARRHGVKIEAFSIGFGKEIFGWTDRLGTRWKVCMIPMGGYLKMFSDSDPTSRPDEKKIAGMTAAEKQMSLFHKPVLQRLEIAAAGPLANYILAFFVIVFIYVFHGQPMEDKSVRIRAVLTESPAGKAGVLPDDVILSVDKQAVHSFADLANAVKARQGDTLTLLIDRQGSQVLTNVAFSDGVTLMGVFPSITLQKQSVLDAAGAALTRCWDVTTLTLKSLGNMILGHQSASSLSGPLGIAKATKEATAQSVWDVLWLGAMISLALGIFNLLPIPALDGGHILFYTIEAVRGKALSIKTQERLMFAGFAILLSVFLFATFNDIKMHF